MSKTLTRWGEFAASLQEAQIPQSTRARLRCQVASVLAASFAGGHDDGARATTAWAQRSSGPHPLLPTGEKLARVEAILGSVARASALDFGDYTLGGELGAAAVTVPIVLGAPGDLAWSEVEVAQAASVELAGRVGLSAWIAARDSSSAQVHRVGGAAAAAKILRLDAQRTSHALGLALSGRTIDLGGAHGDPVAIGGAVVSGVLGAELAFEGLRADLSPAIDAADVLSTEQNAGALGRLCEVWIADTIHVKEHPARAWMQTAIDAAIEVAAQAQATLGRPLVAADVTASRLDTTLWGAQESTAGAATLERASSSIAFATALALLGADLRACRYDEAHFAERAEDARAIADRMVVRHAEELTSRALDRVRRALDASSMLREGESIELHHAITLRLGAPPARALAGDPLPFGRLLADGVRAVLRRSRPRFRPAPQGLEGLGIPFAARLRVDLRGGASCEADRALPRGAPGRSADEAEAAAHAKLVGAASPTLGHRRARRLASLVLDPSRRQRVADVIAAMTRPS